MAVHLSVSFSTFRAFKHISFFYDFHCNGSHFENFEVRSVIYTNPSPKISSFIKLKAFWNFLTFLHFALQQWKLWTHPDFAVSNPTQFHQFWRILIIFEMVEILAGSHGYRDHSQILMEDVTLVHGRQHTIKGSINLTFHFIKVNATLWF